MKKIIMLLLLSTILMLSCAKEQQVQQAEYLVLGTSAIYPPFTYMSGSEHAGLDIELAKVIAKNNNQKLQVVDLSFDRLLPALENGTIDMAMAALTITDELSKIADFSKPYYQASQVALVRKDELESYNDIRTKEQLGENKTLGVAIGTTGALAAKSIAMGKPVVEDEFEIVIAELLNGNIDAIIADATVAKATAHKHDELTILNIKFDSEYYGIAVKRNNTALLNSIDNTMNEIISSGLLHSLEANHVNAYFE